jgi:hypothetical protein
MADMIYCTGEECSFKRHCARNTRTPKDKVGHTGVADPAQYEIFLQPPVKHMSDEGGCNYFWPEAFGDMIKIEIPEDMTMKMGPPIPEYKPPSLPGYEPTKAVMGTPALLSEVGVIPKTFKEAADKMPEDDPPPDWAGPPLINPSGSIPLDNGINLPHSNQPDFTIRAQDRGGPETILEWIKIAGAHGAPPLKLRAAFEVYLAMIKWQRDNPDVVKTPD